MILENTIIQATKKLKAQKILEHSEAQALEF